MASSNDDRKSLPDSVENNVDFPGGAATSGESRTHPRFQFRGRAKAVLFPPDGDSGAEPQESEVVTTDLSRGGLNVLHRKQLYPGQQVLLVLEGTNRMVEVCWCCRIWAGLYSAGCRFVGPAE